MLVAKAAPFLELLMSLPYRLSDVSFKGPFLSVEKAKLTLLSKAVHLNLYMTHRDLPLPSA